MELSAIIQLVIYGVLGLFVLVNFFSGWSKGLWRSLLKLALTVGAAILSFIIVKLFGGEMTAMFVSMLEEAESSDFAKLVNGSEAIQALIRVLMGGLALPISFTSVFISLKLICAILYLIFKKMVPKRGLRILGAIPGVANGLIVTIALLLPVFTYVNVVTVLIEEVPEAEEILEESVGEETMDLIQNDVLNPLYKNVVYSALKTNVVDFAIDQFSSSSYAGERVTFDQMIHEVGGVLEAFMPLMQEEDLNLENLTTDQLACIDNTVTALGESRIMINAVADIVSAFCEKWYAGEDFNGIEAPFGKDLGNIENLLKTILNIFADSNGETIKADLHTICDVAEVLYEKNIIAASKEGGDVLLEKLGEPGTVTAIVDRVGDNQHLRPIIPEVMNLGVWALTQSLGIPEDTTAAYNDLMQNVADLLKDVNPETLEADLGALLEDYGAEIPAELTGVLADVLSDAALDGSITSAEDVMNFFEEYHSMYTEAANMASLPQNGGVVNLAGEESRFAESIRRLMEAADAIEGANQMLSGFAAAETAPIQVITLQDLKTNAETFLQMSEEEVQKEMEALDGIITKAAELVTSMKDATASGDSLALIESLNMEALGGMLESMNSTALLGDKTGDMLEAIMTSKTVKDTGMISKEAVKEIRESLDKGEGELTNALTSVQQTVVLVSTLGSTDKSEEEKDQAVEEKITWLIENMSPQSAKVMNTLINQSILEQNGVPVDYSETTALLLGKLFTKMGDSSGMTEEEYKKEADAIKYFYKVAMTAKNGESGEALPPEEELVNKLLDSKVLSATIEESVFEGDNASKADPLGFASKFSEQNRETIKLHIDNYVLNHPEANRRTVEAIRHFFGLEFDRSVV